MYVRAMSSEGHVRINVFRTIYNFVLCIYAINEQNILSKTTINVFDFKYFT
jgi:hypothetical protein